MHYRALEVIKAVQLYIDSKDRFGPTPFIYPIYGLGGIPEGFQRKCAVGGGVFMLNRKIEEIKLGENGKVETIHGVETNSEQKIGNAGPGHAKTKMIIASPQYLIDVGMGHKVKQVGQVIRCICILGKPVAVLKENKSAQIIIPQKQVNRKSDIYIMIVGPEHATCQEGNQLAIISTTVETKNPHKELEVAFNIIGKPLEKFVTVSPLYKPTDDGKKDGIYVTATLDPTSNFESAARDVLRVYKNITGKNLDLENLPEDE